MTDLSKQRLGISVSERGEEATIGYWPDSLNGYSEVSWVGQTKTAFNRIRTLGARYHAQNRSKPSERPDALVRQQLVAKDAKLLAQEEDNLLRVKDERDAHKAKLRPHEASSTLAELMFGRELIDHYRAANDVEKRRLEKKPEYRRAILERPPELSGVGETKWGMIFDQDIRARYPNEMKWHDDFDIAFEMATTAHKAVKRAHQNEAMQSGANLLAQAEKPLGPAGSEVLKDKKFVV